MARKIKRMLVTGATGQIGSELTRALRDRYGEDNVVATDIEESAAFADQGPFFVLDVTRAEEVAALARKQHIDAIVHLAALLSATGERKPDRAFEVNVIGTMNILQTARDLGMCRVFIPSSIAAFGPGTPLEAAPNDTVLRPTTMYGITKVTCEMLGDYYVRRWGLDVRGVRYPGIISAARLPSGGTTDYAVEMFYAALTTGRYTCFVRADTRLPMLYMPDCIQATMALLAAPFHRLVHHTDFNIGGLDFTASALAEEIRKYVPELICEFKPDFRQAIADSWPRSVDDSAARHEWGWKPTFDLESMVEDMIQTLRKRRAAGTLQTWKEAV